MGDELETREKLLESAMAEFSENGYMKASLRKICADAGVTTGALYFFFKNKNDLFKAIVDEPLKELCRLLTEHYISTMTFLCCCSRVRKGLSMKILWI